MARSIGEAFVTVRADTSGTGAEVERDLGRELDGAGRTSGRRFGKSFGDEVVKAATGGGFKKQFGEAGDDGAQGFFAKFSGRLGPLMANLPISGPLGAAIAGAGVAAAPLLGAAISGAVIGGAGIGGVVGGILIASKDARVQSAAEALGSRIETRLQNAAVPFIDETIAGMDRIESALDGINFDRIFGNAARFVAPLADSVGSLIESLGQGIDDLVANAGPAVDAIADGVTAIGKSVGEGLSGIAANGPAAADALRTVFALIDSGVQSTFALVNMLTELYKINQAIGGDMALRLLLKLTGSEIDHNADASKRAAGAAGEMATSFQAAAPAATGLKAAVAPLVPNLRDIAAATREIHSANADLFASETAVATAVANASKTIKENGRNLTLNSAKGRENRDALTQVASALQNQYDKYVKVNGVGPQSAALADTLRAKFIRLARAAGTSADGAENLANQILDIPSSHDTKITARNEKALEAAREVRRAINSLPSSKVIDVAIRVTGTRAARSAVAAALNKQSLPARAAGGPVTAGQAYIVGERRPEIFVPDRDGTVLPRMLTATRPADGSAAMLARLDRLIAAVEKVAPGVGAHLSRGLRGVDASIGAASDLYARGAW